MEKQIIRVPVDYSLNWTYGVDIKTIREDLDAVEKLGATGIEIETESGYEGSCSTYIVAIIERLETDEEFNARVEKYRIYEKETKLIELAHLQKLKEKYNL